MHALMCAAFRAVVRLSCSVGRLSTARMETKYRVPVVIPSATRRYGGLPNG